MTQSEFIAWLEGFLHDKVMLGASDIDLIQTKIVESTPRGHSIGYYPDPFQNTMSENPIPSDLIQEMKLVAKDVDIIGQSCEGVYVCDSFGESTFMTYPEVKEFIENRKNKNG